MVSQIHAHANPRFEWCLNRTGTLYLARERIIRGLSGYGCTVDQADTLIAWMCTLVQEAVDNSSRYIHINKEESPLLAVTMLELILTESVDFAVIIEPIATLVLDEHEPTMVYVTESRHEIPSFALVQWWKLRFV